MFNSSTVFVVGAGASKEAGLPMGSELKEKIAISLNIRFREFGPEHTGSRRIVAALRDHTKGPLNPNGIINEFLLAAHSVREAMPHALSIDNFIEAHDGNAHVELCGKLAIADNILNAEKSSKLYIDHRRSDNTGLGDMKETWYLQFSQMLFSTVIKSKLSKVFDNITIITFNYDRCIEHYLYYALQAYYRISEAEAADLMQSLVIYYPYGTTGRLPWQKGTAPLAMFGDDRQIPLLEIAKQLKTFSERVEEGAMLLDIRDRVAQANKLIFMGFAYHEQNLAIIAPGVPAKAAHIYGTTLGISTHDTNIVSEDIRKILHIGHAFLGGMHLTNATCSQFFSEFWRGLAR